MILHGKPLTPEERALLGARLLAAWERTPQLRLGQLLLMAVQPRAAAAGRLPAELLLTMEDRVLVELVVTVANATVAAEQDTPKR